MLSVTRPQKTQAAHRHGGHTAVTSPLANEPGMPDGHPQWSSEA